MAKIAIFSCYQGVVDRGVETFASEISKRLAVKFDVTLVQSGSKANNLKVKVVKISSKFNVPKSSKGFLGKVYFDTQSLKVLLFTLKSIPLILKNKYQVLIPLNGGWQVLIIRVLAKITKSKMLISGHAGIGSDDAWNLLFKPDIFVALTTPQLHWAKKLSPETNSEKIPNGVDLAKFNPKVKKANVNLEEPIVVCASALVPYKRVDLTVKAVARTNNLSLLVLGDGEMKGSIDSLGKRLLGNRYLRICVPYEKVANYYRAANVFSLVSKTEAFGISYLEAMACNLPVVATSDASRAEIVGRAGILTNAEDIDQYTKDLQIAAKTNYRNIPYDQALNFSWNKVARQYENSISKLIS